MIARALSITIVVFSLSLVGMAEPKNVSGDSNEAITRSELVTELGGWLEKWESEQANFATKRDITEVREQFVEMKSELESQGSRVEALEARSGEIENRVEHTARPGF